MTLANIEELGNMERNAPHMQQLLRIDMQDDMAVCKLGTESRAPLDATDQLLLRALDFGLGVKGVSFHIGTASNARVSAIP